MLCNFQKLITIDTARSRKPYSTKNSLCTVMSLVWYLHITQTEISQERSKIAHFCKISYQPILRYLYAGTIKRRDKIWLHKHFKTRTFSGTTVERSNVFDPRFPVANELQLLVSIQLFVL